MSNHVESTTRDLLGFIQKLTPQDRAAISDNAVQRLEQAAQLIREAKSSDATTKPLGVP